jgi:glutamate N-acetyltransferase/amino-acid N-acetyltransferase
VAVGVCHPAGFAAAAAAAGMKPGGDDVALVVSDRPAAAAGVFTTNLVAAAPVLVSRAQVAGGSARAVVTNSGLANACTGRRGLADAWSMVAAASRALRLPREQVLVASTGVIGRPLPIDDVTAAIAAAAARLDPQGGAAAAEAIRTTDAFRKTASAQVELAAGPVRIGGMAKGAGMIRPDMATTLGQITTDAAVPSGLLARLLRRAVDASFNAISVDGCTSTNDCVFALANGASGAAIAGAEDERRFGAALTAVASDLARQVVRDGEGTTRVCTFTVTGAEDDRSARTAARAVAENVLVKCAMHGGDPNWGRMLAALGAAGVRLDPDRVGIAVGDQPIVAAGTGVEGGEARARQLLAGGDVAIAIELGGGPGRATVVGSDLSPDYVRFNAGATS